MQDVVDLFWRAGAFQRLLTLSKADAVAKRGSYRAIAEWNRRVLDWHQQQNK